MKKILMPPANSIELFIKNCETYKISPAAYTLAFLCLSFIRNFLEGALGPAKSAGTNHEAASALLQMGTLFNLEWITLLLALALVISAAAAEKLVPVLKILLLSYSIIIIVPFADLLLNFPEGCRIDYLYSLKDYTAALMYFFLPTAAVNVCPGIRLEVFFGFILSAAYIYIKTKNPLRTALGSLALYFLAVSSMAYPVFILSPVLPFTGTNTDIFIREFFYSSAYSGGMLNRTAIMIFILLIPLLLTAYFSHYGAKAGLLFLKKIFSPAPVAAAAFLSAGWILSARNTGSGVFLHPIDAFALTFAIIIALLIFLYSGSLKEKNHSTLEVVPFLIAVSAPALSFPFFLICIFILSLAAILYLKPFNLAALNFAEHLYFAAACCALTYAGSALITGADVFSKTSPMLPLLVLFTSFFAVRAAAPGSSTRAHAGLFISILLFPVILNSISLYIPAVVIAIVSGFLSRPAGNTALKKAVIFLPLSVLAVITGLLA